MSVCNTFYLPVIRHFPGKLRYGFSSCALMTMTTLMMMFSSMGTPPAENFSGGKQNIFTYRIADKNELQLTNS